jgi:hypothetical protein
VTAAVRISAQIVGWLFAIVGWIVALLFGFVSLALLLIGNPFSVYAVPLFLIGLASASFGRSLERSFYPALSGRSTPHGQ